MTTTADIDPDHDVPDPLLDAPAAASRGERFQASPSIAADLEETGRAHSHLRQEQQRGNAALERGLRALFRQ